MRLTPPHVVVWSGLVSEQWDIGTEFAVRWLDKNHPVRAPKRQSPLDAPDFCSDVASAVNAYAEKKRAELENTLRRVITGALSGAQEPVCVEVSAKELLESECMTFIAKKIIAGMSPVRRFPVSLHS